MPRISLDTNILIYAVDPTDSEKQETARRVVRLSAGADSVLTQQVLGEFLNVSRKLPQAVRDGLLVAADEFAAVFPLATTSKAALFEAYERANRYQLQFWDALIVTVCLARSVDIFVSEDMQDGMNIDGLRVINPFIVGNLPNLTKLLEA